MNEKKLILESSVEWCKVLDLTVGSVSSFEILDDSNHLIMLLIDEKLCDKKFWAA